MDRIFIKVTTANMGQTIYINVSHIERLVPAKVGDVGTYIVLATDPTDLVHVMEPVDKILSQVGEEA